MIDRPDLHRMIRAAVRAFEAARATGDRSDSEPDFDRLGVALRDAGYAALILDGTFYASTRLVAEMGDPDDEHGSAVFRAALILNLDATR